MACLKVHNGQKLDASGLVELGGALAEDHVARSPGVLHRLAYSSMKLRFFNSTLVCAIVALLLQMVCLPALAEASFDRAKQGERYRAWLAQFETDLKIYRAALADGKAQSADDVADIFRRSVVPGSRAHNNAQQIFGSQRPDYSTSGEIVFVGEARVLLNLLHRSVPAGYGGVFPEAAGSAFPSGLSVWYMHVDGGDELEQDYFASPKYFEPYRLPPHGVLVRKAYPFLLFEDAPDRLRLGGFSAEYWRILEIVWNIQFH